MEIDAPPEPDNVLSPRDRIVQRLVHHGVPEEQLNQFQPGLISFVQKNKLLIPELVSAILPTDVDVAEVQMVARQESGGGKTDDLFGESLFWLQWLMFEDDPQASLDNLSQKAAGQRAVCGAVWGYKDLAYRCRTCEHDPTCAICVPCFQNGNHKDHDYSIMYTGGGCCDCGDITAWKREGFCSKHKGAERIQPLPDEIVGSVGPVLDALLACWEDKLLLVDTNDQGHPGEGDHTDVCGKVANELSDAAIKMLLEFCNCSESLLSFISQRIFECVGLLDVLVRAEIFLDKQVVKKLHELLLRLLGEPLFKYEFAKVFIRYYLNAVNETLKNVDNRLEKYPLLSTFSVQLFTVPTLTPRLVREVNLLGVLLQCLWNLFHSCIEDGCLQVDKWANLYVATIRLIEDTRYVMSHDEVPKYVVCERPDIFRTWIRILGLVQGMDPQKRITGLHAEEENENLHTPFALGYYLGNVYNLLVDGASSVEEAEEKKYTSSFSTDTQYMDDGDRLRHAKVGRLSQESSVCYMSSRAPPHSGSSPTEGKLSIEHCLSVPSSVTGLIFECLKTIENWLGPDIVSRTLRRDGSSTRVYGTSLCWTDSNGAKVTTWSELCEGIGPSALAADMNACPGSAIKQLTAEDEYSACARGIRASDDRPLDGDSGTASEALGILSLADWPEIIYDVSLQEVSFHIPLHRLLSLLLRKAMKKCYGETEMLETANRIHTIPLSGQYHDFFSQALGRFHPYGFSASVMEHPLQLRVFCAQVRAGMWRKNGDAGMMISDWYRNVRWFEIGVESDLFLLQCCAALAPAELFVKRIQERFGLSNYLCLDLTEHNEYEPVLVQEMLTLIIQIATNRRFCGSSTAENLQRELVYKLAIGDATHSQLVKSLPRDLSKSDQLQKVVDTLAVYANPSGMKQGKYSLRKAYWKELDLYHPRWNSRDLQVAEERYLRFCKVSALNVQLPRWTKVFYPLSTICRIATSKMILQIVRAVLFYAVFTEKSSVSRAPEGVLVTALHLLSLALDICDKHVHNVGTNVVETSCYGEDLFPVLKYARENINKGTDKGPTIWENQTLLSLLVSLMKKCKRENDHNHGDTRLCNISSLIECLLKKFAQLDSDCMTELKRLVPDAVCHMPQYTLDGSTQNLLSVPGIEERKAKVRERQAAILEKMKAEQSKFIASLKSTVHDESDISKSKQEASNQGDGQEESEPICSLCHDTDSKVSVSFLILLQKSRLSSFVDRGPPTWDASSGSDKDHLSVTKGSPSMGDSSSPEVDQSSRLVQLLHNVGHEFAYDLQPMEVDAFLDLLRARLPDIRSTQQPNASRSTNTNFLLSLEMMENEIYQSIQEDINGTHSDILADEQRCPTSLAAEGSRNSRDVESAVVGEYVASLSRESSIHPLPYVPGLSQLSNASSRSTVTNTDFDRFGPMDCDGIHISSCGHAVHQDCHDRYLSSLKQRYIRRLGFDGGHIVDPDLGELLCPVCRRFSNSILPVLSGDTKKVWRQTLSSDGGLTSTAVLSSTSDSENNVLHLSQAISLLRSTAKMVGQGRFLKVVSGKLSETIEPALEPVLRKLCTMYFPNSNGSLSASGRLSHSPILWDTLRYSLISMEIAARGRMSTGSEDSNSRLEALYGELQSSNGFILSLLLKVAQTTRSLNRLQVLVRFRGIQLLAASICSGVFGDSNSSNIDRRRGTLSSILERIRKEEVFPDTQFWKQAADPILAHDPFSSLMWVLFSLPLPFVSSTKSFVALVHVFYVVCVIQALITCHSKHRFDKLSFGDCLVNDICKTVGESELAQQFFVSSYVDHSCDPKDMVRRFTSPYLRRCALLWKLLKSSTSTPCYDNSHVWDKLTPYINNDVLDNTNSFLVELKEVKELEKMFQICSLEAVLKDKVVHTLALKWCGHLREDFSVRNKGCMLYSTPAVPFRLTRLPLLYQDLLQRYIKQQCPECKAVPDEPALCLLCGRLCSPSWKSCCRASRCQSHTLTCGAGIGVFLLIRRTTILLQRSARQAPWPSPYLDAFGEEDHDMNRGRPLYLSEERYAALTYLVASHGLDRSFD